MQLEEFLRQTLAETNAQIGEKLGASGGYKYAESVFAEVVMQHLADIGMTYDPVVLHYSAKLGKTTVKLSGYALSEDGDQLDLFVSVYQGAETVQSISDSETKQAAEQCVHFVAKCADGSLANSIDETDDAYGFVLTVQESYEKLEQIRVFVLTDRLSKSKSFKAREVKGKSIKLEVMDIERLHRHWSEGKPRDELVVSFEEAAGAPLPCVYVSGKDYDYALTAIPGEALRFVYEKFGARLLEANVRSFLSTTGKVNRGIRDTLLNSPDLFMAYNNGIVVVADEVRMGRTEDGGPGIVYMRGMQIVNGGQTTASIYFGKRKTPAIDLGPVRVPAKIIVLKKNGVEDEEALIADISKFANTQNSVKQSDLSANKPFHVELEKLSVTTYCPDGVGRWFYERAAGGYNTMLAREATTPAKLKHLREVIVPPSRKVTKTDLAKVMNAWHQLPHLVSLGAQKNFERYMDSIDADGLATPALDAATYKNMIAKAIIFRRVTSMVRPMFQAFQANVAAYLIATVAHLIGDRLNLDRIWASQDISPQMRTQLEVWAKQVNAVLHASAGQKMISEWAKRSECWDAVRAETFAPVDPAIPELR